MFVPLLWRLRRSKHLLIKLRNGRRSMRNCKRNWNYLSWRGRAYRRAHRQLLPRKKQCFHQVRAQHPQDLLDQVLKDCLCQLWRHMWACSHLLPNRFLPKQVSPVVVPKQVCPAKASPSTAPTESKAPTVEASAAPAAPESQIKEGEEELAQQMDLSDEESSFCFCIFLCLWNLGWCWR